LQCNLKSNWTLTEWNVPFYPFFFSASADNSRVIIGAFMWLTVGGVHHRGSKILCLNGGNQGLNYALSQLSACLSEVLLRIYMLGFWNMWRSRNRKHPRLQNTNREDQLIYVLTHDRITIFPHRGLSSINKSQKKSVLIDSPIFAFPYLLIENGRCHLHIKVSNLFFSNSEKRDMLL